MRSVPALALGLLLLAPLAALPADAVTPPGPLPTPPPPPSPADVVDYAAGPIHHWLAYEPGSTNAAIYEALYGEPVCEGDGLGVVRFDWVSRRALLLNPDTACLPGFSEVQNCQRLADGGVHCHREDEDTQVTLHLAGDGALWFRWWEQGDFDEVITGQLVRVTGPDV